MRAPAPVTVVVPTIGRPELLGRLLHSLTSGDTLAEEILIIDQSRDGKVAELISAFAYEGMRRVPCAGLGVARAVNLGLRHARHETVLVTHDDCVVAKDWIRLSGQSAIEAPGEVLTGQVRPANGSAWVPSCRTDPVARELTSPRDFNQLYPSCMVLPRRATLAIGGFDERFVTAAEDLDFAYRWLRAGGRMRYLPEMIVDHHDWRDTEALKALYRRYWTAQGAFYGKHLRRGDLAMLGFMRFDVGMLLRAARRRKPEGSPVDEWHGAVPGLVTGLARSARGRAA